MKGKERLWAGKDRGLETVRQFLVERVEEEEEKE